MLPGKAMAGVRWDSPSDMVAVARRPGRNRYWDNAYRAKTVNFLDVNVSAETSPAMKKRYEDVQRQLDDPIIPPDQKGQLLNIVGNEKHYFAAKFLREYAEKQAAGPLRDAAVWQLLKLAEGGHRIPGRCRCWWSA